jgi:hypothetical protein
LRPSGRWLHRRQRGVPRFLRDFLRVPISKEFSMATLKSKSGAAGRHKAARPTQSHTAGKRGPQSKRSESEPKLPDSKDDANARSSREEPAGQGKPGGDQRNASSTSESGGRSPTRGSRWERPDDDTLITRPDDPGAESAPLADSDEPPEGSER